MTKSESPVVVVLSGLSFTDNYYFTFNMIILLLSLWLLGSMEPAFQRGDILFLNNQDDPIRVGEIVVFKIKDRDIPIVHRVMKVHEKELGKVEVLTKGDNNRVDDRGLYAPGQLWLQREDILGIIIIIIISTTISTTNTTTTTIYFLPFIIIIYHDYYH